MSQSFSPIQNGILSKLKNASSMRYSELRPGNIPNDLFNYHLQFLVKKEFLTKSDDGYSLSASGIQYVADPFTETNGITSLFKVNVITIVSRVIDGKIEILNQERASNPSYGKVGVMGGVVLKGEPILQAASRKLKQETGLDAAFRLMGCERRIMYVAGELFSDVLFPIAHADTFQGELLTQTTFGYNKWVPIDQAILNESAEFDSIPSIAAVLRAIRDGTIHTMPMFFEESIQNGPANP
jgi:8-oxo-dGTP pyrophosphatase MutT (NUDIX family)